MGFIVFEAIPNNKKDANEENQKYSPKEDTNLTNSSVLHGCFLAGAFSQKIFFG